MADANGQFSYTFGNVLSPAASGTWAVGMEARRMLATVHYDALTDTFPWPYTGETLTESASNRVQYVDTATGSMWTGTPGAAPPGGRPPTPATTATAGSACTAGCATDLEYCLMCHAPDQTDWGRRPKRTDGNVNLATVASAKRLRHL